MSSAPDLASQAPPGQHFGVQQQDAIAAQPCFARRLERQTRYSERLELALRDSQLPGNEVRVGREAETTVPA